MVTQQRHKVKLDEINNFMEQQANQGELISAIFSQINPFSQFVIKDLHDENKAAPSEAEPKVEESADQTEKPIWKLHENLFKRPNHEVKPETLEKTSYQMFSVYKYYENPSL